MASVKEFQVETAPTATELGRGAFVFTDAYSVFDWGRMPDDIPRKGAALCTMGAANFEALEAAGVPTHYCGVGDAAVSIDELDDPSRRMEIELTQTPELSYTGDRYDYETFHDDAGENYLIPLEIVFRNRVPIGSSLRRRTRPGDHDLSYTDWPDHAITLAQPIVEFSTKFEESDRYLTDEEAARIAGAADLDQLRELARDVNRILTERAEAVGLTHLDGKFECLYHRGTIKVADVVGTFDENRFAYDGQQLSKEVVRQYYKRADPAWVEAVAEAKRAANAQDVPDWRSLCDASPSPLPDTVVELVSDMYASGADAFGGRARFRAPPLHVVAARVEALTADESATTE